MPTIKDVIVKKPSDEEAAVCKAWPTWKCQPSTFDWEYTEKETCLLIEGKVYSFRFKPQQITVLSNI